MKLIIHRGANCIGGSCVEVATANTRIIIDVGRPLTDPADQRVEAKPAKPTRLHYPSDDPDLLQVPGLFQPGPRVDAILISHAHMDHTGLLGASNPDIPVYCSRGTSKMLMAGSIFAMQAKLDRKRERVLQSEKFLEIGDIKATPYSVDHSAFDGQAFLLEADGKSLIYSGDLRFHGRKPGMSKVLLDAVDGKPIDVLLMEGTNVSKETARCQQTEYELEETVLDHIRKAPGLVLANFSPMHLDRMVTFYKAARRANREFVVDVYGAFVLRLISGQCKIPKAEPQNGIRVYYNQYFEQNWKKNNLTMIHDIFIHNRIELADILKDPDQYVMMFRPSMMRYDFAAGLPPRPRCVYSYWHGYLVTPEYVNLSEKLKSVGGELIECHTSGHAFVEDLVKFVESMNPKCIVPIHTLASDKYAALFKNTKIKLLQDREEMEITN
jgi:ribonuclease J